MAHKIQHRFPELQEYVDHTIYEARSDVGGTWLINTYPGVQCDVPSHIYAFPFDPNPDWSRFYSSGEEIENYIKNTVKKWNLDRDLQLNTKVVGAYWEEEAGRWRLVVECDGSQWEDYCDVLISAQGVLVYVEISSFQSSQANMIIVIIRGRTSPVYMISRVTSHTQPTGTTTSTTRTSASL